MRCLLVNPAYPETYWSLTHMLPFVGRRWLVAPLSLITVAALLPRHWELRLIDLAVEPLRDADLQSADVVMLSGMLVQRASLEAVLRRCRTLGVRTVVGGPYATAQPERLGLADHLVLGEAEQTLPRFAAELEAGIARRVYREAAKPSLESVPVPRFDLLRPDAYHYMAVQFSRGCPFECEFCDVIALYGRAPRTKPAAHIIAELEAILAAGFRGRVMFVDDNFIGSKKAVRELLLELAAWRERTRAPLDFFTEASLDLAEQPGLVRAMALAGFAVVFVGIETPRAASLREARKHQNLRGDPVERVRNLRQLGLDVWAGFIIGFDHDDETVFQEMIRFVQTSGIAYAMVGMLIALPGTALYERLGREGRLRDTEATGDMFALTNVVTRMPERTLVEGYLQVLETLYEPATYFARCREHLRHYRPAPGLALAAAWGDLPIVMRSLWRQGVRGTYRREYFRFLLWASWGQPRKLALALAQACAGHHFIRYTRETVAPRLRRELSMHGPVGSSGAGLGGTLPPSAPVGPLAPRPDPGQVDPPRAGYPAPRGGSRVEVRSPPR